MEDTIRLFRKQLFSAFEDWLKTNKSVITEKGYEKLLKLERDAWGDCDTALKIIGVAMWMFNMVSNFGVMAGLGPNNVNIQHIDRDLDEKSTKRILHLCAACLSLQYLPKEIATKPIPIISSKRFSLKLWTEQR